MSPPEAPLLLPVVSFKRVFDTTPQPEVLTLPQLVAALRRFELKTATIQAIERDLRRIDDARDRVLQNGSPRGPFMGRLKAAAEDAQRGGADTADAVRQLAEAMKEDVRRGAKRDLRIWSPALYRPGATERGKDNVTHLGCLVLDYDDGTPIGEASDLWSGWFHCVHTTWSHREERPKFRVVLPLLHLVPAEDWDKVWSWAETHAHFEIDPSMKSPAATYALPAVRDRTWPREAFSRPGAILSPVDEGILTRRVTIELSPHGPPDGSPSVVRGLDPDKTYIDHVDPDDELEGPLDLEAPEGGPAARNDVAPPEEEEPPRAEEASRSPAPEGSVAVPGSELERILRRLDALAERLGPPRLAEDLERLQRLYADGFLRAEELDAAKARLLTGGEVGGSRRIGPGAHRRTLCFDFDGVLHSYRSGWQGALSIPDPPVEGALAYLERASEHFDIAIASVRSGHPGAVEAMKAWLRRHGLPERVLVRVSFPLQKPPAALYIDDRGYRFEGTFPPLAELASLRPWTESA